MHDLLTIKERLQAVQQAMQQAAERSGRHPDDIKLLLVTKTVDIQQVKQAIDLGQTLFGENKVQELKEKAPALEACGVTWHFIGHLQTNKIGDVIRYASMIHSLDRLRLAEALNRRLEREGKIMDVLIQVNTSGEASKFGVPPEEAAKLLKAVHHYPTLRVRGLMTIGKFSSNPEDARIYFRRLRLLRDELSLLDLPNVELTELSMGMSGDFEVAIEEGATIVRVGTKIFGPRLHPDAYYWPDEEKKRP